MRKRACISLLGGSLVIAANVSIAQGSTIVTGDLTNYAILFNGDNGASFTTNNSGINGNIGIGATGRYSGAGGGNAIINGVVNFAAPNTGQFSISGGVYTPSISPGVNPLYNVAAVTTAVSDLNTLAAQLRTLATTNPAITLSGNMTINLGTPGFMPNANGIVVVPVTGVNFSSLTINGDAANDAIVFNLTGLNNPQVNGRITLNGLTPDQVVINQTNSSGLRIQAAGAIQQVDYLDPLGAFIANSINLDEGRILGGDTQNSTFVSNAFITAPPSAIPLPAALPLLATGLGALGLFAWPRGSGRWQSIDPNHQQIERAAHGGSFARSTDTSS